MNTNYILYGQELSYFTQKVKDYLRYKEVPFIYKIASKEIIENFIRIRTGVKYIPVLLLPDNRIIQDTSCIFDYVEQKFPKTNITTNSPILRLIGIFTELFSDEWLVVPAIHYRWNFQKVNYEHVVKSFGSALAPRLSPEEQFKKGKLYARFFSGARSPLGICAETIPIIEQETHRLLNLLHKHFSIYNFMLGDEPTLADFSLMGCLAAHLGLDPYPASILKQKYPAVIKWISKMRQKEFANGKLIHENSLPPSLVELLRLMLDTMESYLCVLIPHLQKELVKDMKQYKLSIPRNLGDITFQLEGIPVHRKATIFTQWMLQRFTEELKNVGDKKRKDLFLMLDQKDYFSFELPIKVERETLLNVGETLPAGSTLKAVYS